MIYLSFCYKLLQVNYNWDPRTTQTPLNWDPSWFRPPQLRRLPIQNPLFYLKSWVTGGTEIQLFFSGQNDLILSLCALREKIESYWPKKWSHWRNWNSTELFRSKWLKLFSQCTERKKLSHCDLKSWVTGWTKIRPNFSGQSESIFFSVCTPSQKIESFLGMYRISGSYPVIRLSGTFFTIRYPAIRYPVCYSIIRYPAGYHTGIRPDTG